MKPADVDRLLDWLEKHATDRAGKPMRLMPWQQRLLEDLIALRTEPSPPLRLQARAACTFRPRNEDT
jgi:hypothetical protein